MNRFCGIGILVVPLASTQENPFRLRNAAPIITLFTNTYKVLVDKVIKYVIMYNIET